MKKVLLLLLLCAVIGNSYSQIRLVEVDPTTEFVSIKNFGGSSEDISSYRLCALFVYKTLSTMTLESGNLNLGAGETVIVSGWALNNSASDLGIYLATGSFGSTAAMVDFTQWGAGGLGRESVAVSKGIWDAGDFIEGDAPYTYIGDGTQIKLPFWQAAPNTETDILTYSFPEESDPANIDAVNHTVDIEVEFGTEVDNLIATFTLSEGATAQVSAANQESSVTANDFTNPVTYKVTAEDGTTTQDWVVTVTVALNSEADILSYSFTEETGPATLGDGTVDIEVTMGTILSNLVATFTLSENASAAIVAILQVSGVTANDFTNPVTYTVTAEDGTTKDWIITVTEDQPPSTETDFITFSFTEQTGSATINATNHTIDIELNPGTDPSALTATFTLSEGATVEVGSNPQLSGVTINDFMDPVVYEVTAEDGIVMQNWTITVTVALNTETDIILFTIPDQLNDPVINSTTHTVDIEVNSQTNLTGLVATFELSLGATAEVNSAPQISGNTSNDFSNPVTYRITAEDGVTFQDWTVTVTVILSNETDFSSFSVPGQTNLDLDNTNHTIDIEVEPGTVLTSLIATFELSFGASAEINTTAQTSGTTSNDFSNPVTYTTTAEDGTIQDWVVTVIFDPQTDFLSFTFPEETGSAIINPVDHTILIEVEFGTDPTSLIASFSLSDGAAAEISTVAQLSEVTSNDFTNPVTYIVISSGGTNTQNWVVTLTFAPSNETDLLTFSVPGQTGPPVIDADNHTVDVEVAFGTDLTNLASTFTFSEGASLTVNDVAQESGVTVNNFNDPVIYLVTAENGTTTQEWEVAVAIAPNSQTGILAFSFAEQTGPSEINSVAGTIGIEVEFGTDLINLVAIYELSAGATAVISGMNQQSGVTSNNFTNPLIYTVTAEDETTIRDWTVTVTLAPNTETDFLSFSLPEETGTAIINANDHIIDVEVAFGTDLTNLVATYALSIGASATLAGVAQESGVTTNDFSTPIIYTVMAEDAATMQDWSVCVTMAPNSEARILTFSFQEQIDFAAIDDLLSEIRVEVEVGVDITNLIASFTLSEGATASVNDVVQESGVTTNDFSAPVIFKVTAQDGTSIQDWTVKVTQQAVTGFEDFRYSVDMQVYPNPVSDHMFLRVDNNYYGPLTLSILDISGKVLSVKRILKTSSRLELEVPAQDLGEGFLLVRMTIEDQVIIRRVIKK